MGKKIVLLSGGMDSTTGLALALSEGHQVETLSFNYGSKHNDREYQHAQAICHYYGVKNTRIDLPFINELFKSDLLNSGGEIPDGHYADESMKRTVVPFRNGIMLSVAVGYAESVKAESIVLSNHAGDHAIYPDCRKEFSDAFGEAVSLGTDGKVKLEYPFCDVSKTRIAVIGKELRVPYVMTWSCYKGGKIHCGVCGTCYERKEAFKDSRIQDPTEYMA